MNAGTGPIAIYYLMIVVAVASSLVAMRLPLAKTLKMGLAWVAIFGVGFVIFSFRGEFLALGDKLKAEAVGAPITDGAEVRVPMAEDGHFWVQAKVNGRPSRFLIDSGASVTTIARDVAQQSGIPNTGQHIVVDTANGPAPATEAYADKLEVGSIARSDFPVDINDRDQTNVLGMNFLSSLHGWRVQGNYLVLQP